MTSCPKLKSLFIDLADLTKKCNDGDDGGDDDPNVDSGARSHYVSDSDDDGQDDHDSPDDTDDADVERICDIDISLTEFGDILREHGGNLEELSFSTFHCQQDLVLEVWGGIGSLRELTRLRHLKIHYWDLLGFLDGDDSEDDPIVSSLKYERFSDVLPASIETLYLYNGKRHPYGYYQQDEADGSNSLVKALLAEAETWAPNLRKVMVERWENKYQWEKLCEIQWSRETIDDRWDIRFAEGRFEYEVFSADFIMTLVILTKKEKGHN
ncbi:hypothetical protein ACHAPM_007440 [Fusarium culmorum]